MKSFRIKDKFTIKGEIFKPKKGKKFKTILLVHGYLGYMHQKQFKILTDEFVKKGFCVVRFDFSCGQGESSGKYSQAKVSQWQYELKKVISFVRELDFVSELILLGHSLGGLLCAQQGIFADKLITLNGLYKIPVHVRHYNYAPKKKVHFKLPPTFVLDMIFNLRMPKFAKLNLPVLVLHSLGDEMLPVTDAERAHKKYKNSKLIVFESHEHTLRDEKVIKSISREIVKWIKNN